MVLRAGAGGLQFDHPSETEDVLGQDGKPSGRKQAKQVRFEAGEEVDPAQLPEKSRANLEGLIAAGFLVHDGPVEVKGASEEPPAESPRGRRR